MTKTETHTNKPLLRVLLAAAALLLLCGAAVGGAAAVDEPKIIYHANNGINPEQTYTQPFTPGTLVELEWEQNMKFTAPKDTESKAMEFLGWVVGSPTATEYYINHQPVSLTNTDDVHLYAQWAPITYLSEDILYYDGSYWISDSGYYRLSDDLTTNITVSNARGNILVVLDLYGCKLEAKDSEQSTVTIYKGAVVTIKDDTGGGDGTITNGNSGVYLHDGGTLSLQRGTICDNKGIASPWWKDPEKPYGGGVYVENQSHFFMIGGSIEDNSANNGGGVYVDGNSTFTMTGGIIEDNEADDEGSGGGGGVYVADNSTFTMTGGSITENEAEKYGGGVYISGSTFTMTCGNIAENTSSASGGGVYVSGSTFTMSGGSITENEAEYGGGGVYNDGTFTMSGTTASITGNEAERYGGGVYLYAGTFTMKGGSIKGVGISSGDSVADYGGGVYVYSGTFNMEGGTIWDCMADDDGGGVYVAGGMFKMTGTTACITGNFASGSGSDNGYGGGVYFDGSMFTMTCGSITKNKADTDGGGVYVAGGMFTMSGGSITENFATGISSDNGYGGGVYVTRDGTFEMTGGSITKNKAYNNGGGVYVSGRFNVSESPVIRDNYDDDEALNNVWPTAKNQIILTGKLESDADIRISNPSSGQFGVVDPSYTTATPDDVSRFHKDKDTDIAILKKVDGIDGIIVSWDDGTRYTVTYDSNGATGGAAPVDESQYIYGASVTVLPPPEGMGRTDHHFASWNTQKDGKGQDYAPGDIFTIRENMTLYAKWVINEERAIVLLTNGHGTVSSDPLSAKLDTLIQLTANPDTGYTFEEWRVEKGEITITNNTFTMPDSDVKIRGVFTPNTYEVQFDKNGADGTETMASQPFTYDAAQNLSENTYTKTGYTFDGWATSSTGDVAYADKASVFNLTDVDGATVTLYAHWTPNTYTVSFDANGGTGTMAPQSFTYDAAQNLSENTYARVGYTFDGWATSSTGDAAYTDKESVSNLTDVAGATVTLYAHWTPNTYTVKFNANGGSGTMSDQSFTYDEEKNLTANAFTNTGKYFAGWNTVSTATAAQFSDGQSVKNLTTENNATVNLYAVWSATPMYIVTAEPVSCGTLTVDKVSAAAGDTVTVTATPDAGYKVSSLTYTPASGRATKIPGTTFTMPAENVTVNAVFDLIPTPTPEPTPEPVTSYILTYHANGAASGTAPASQTCTEGGDPVTIAGPGSLTKDGYSFLNWNTAADGSGDGYTAGEPVTLTRDLRLYAQWLEIPVLPEEEGEVEISRDVTSHTADGEGMDVKLDSFSYQKEVVSEDGVSSVEIGAADNEAGEAVIKIINPETDTVAALFDVTPYDADGNKLSSVSNGITVHLTVTLNPGEKGEDITILHYNKATGEWEVLDAEVIETPPGSGVWTVSVTVYDFSPFTVILTPAYRIINNEPELFTVPEYAAPGKTVTIAVEDREDWFTYRPVVFDAHGKDIPVSSSEGQTYIFTMPASDVTVDKELIKRYIVLDEPENGTISVDGSGYYGEEITVTAVPDEGYLVKSVAVVTSEAVPVPVVREGDVYVFSMPASDVFVTAEFAKIRKSGGGGEGDEGTSVWGTATVDPTKVPTAVPTVAPTVEPTKIPTQAPVSTETPAAKTPAPFLGIVAGLGAAAAVFGMRRR